MSSRRAGRRTALFLLYQWDVTGQQLASLYDGEIDPFSQELAEAVVEEHEQLDDRITAAADEWTADRLGALERNVFEFARPGVVVVTTPNVEYNARFEHLPASRFRHKDHRFEWTRGEFRAWAENSAARFGYAVRFLPVGPEDPALGPPTQMGVFTRA